MKSCAILGLNTYTSARTRHSSFCIASPAKISTLSSQDQHTNMCQFSQNKPQGAPHVYPTTPVLPPPFLFPPLLFLYPTDITISTLPQPTTCPLPHFHLEIRNHTYLYLFLSSHFDRILTPSPTYSPCRNGLRDQNLSTSASLPFLKGV